MVEKRHRKLVPGSSPIAPTSPLASTSADASSSGTPAPIHIANDDDLPPSYSSPSHSSTSVPNVVSPPAPNTVPGMPPVEFSLYRIPGAVVSKDLMTCTTNIAEYSWSAPPLLDLLQTQLKLPPHPQIRIRGTRDGLGDFDIRISMLRYIARPPDPRGGGGWNYVKLIGPADSGWRGGKQESRTPSVNGGLEEWVSRFIAEESKDKSFTLQKQITNWNTDYLEGQIRNLVASTNYKGKLAISFPVTHSRVVIQAPSNKPWYQAIAAAFQPSQARRYEVLTAVWPYAALAPDESRGQGNSWAVKSEAQFWAEWKDVLKLAVLERRTGWLSLEDQIEYAMGAAIVEGKKQTRDWDRDYPASETI